jgi:hypothetical protein
MRKFVTVVASIALIITGAYALVTSLYPDTVDFPRVPMGVGSIGEVVGRILGETDLANYAWDGTVENSEKLGGITATGYLKKKDICIAGEVIIGIDADGKWICWVRNTLLAVNMGTISEISGWGTATVYHASGTSSPITIGTIFYAGDIIETDPSTSITLAFSDLSLIRLEPDTTIFLNLETLPDTTTLAKAIIENGGMWWRVLSETGGYLIGRDDVVVWVRGTSVYATENNPVSIAPKGGGVPGWDIVKAQPHGNGSIEIIHSSKNFGEIVWDTSCRNFQGTISTGNIRLWHWQIDLRREMTGCLNPDMIPLNDGQVETWRERINDRYEEKRVIAENTVKDLRYIANYLYSGSVELTPNKRILLTQEFQNTFPNNALGYDAICPDDGLPVVKKVFWPSLIGTGISINPCMDEKVVAIADYTNIRTIPTKKNIIKVDNYFFWPNPWNNIAIETDNWLKIYQANNNHFLTYDANIFGFGLSNKKVIVELWAPVGTSITGSWSKAYIIDTTWGGFWEKWYAYFGKECDNDSAEGKIYLCKHWSNVNFWDIKTSTSIEISLSTNSSWKFMIGNQYAPGQEYWVWWIRSYPMPIGTTIKSIKILQN